MCAYTELRVCLNQVFDVQHYNIMSSIGVAYQGKDIVFRFIIEYRNFRDFGPQVIGLFLYEDF